MQFKEVLHHARNGFDLVGHQFFKSVVIAMLDVVMVITVSFMFSYFFRTIMGPIMTIIQFLTLKSEGNLEQLREIIPTQAALNSLLNDVFINTTWFFFAVMIAWIFFQGLAWHIAYRASREKSNLSLLKYLKRFALANMVFFILTYLIIVLFSRLSYASALYDMIISAGFSMSLAQLIILFFGAICLIATLMIMPVTYVILYHKRSLKTLFASLKKLKKRHVFRVIIISVVLILVLLYISQQFQAIISPYIGAMLLIGFIIDFGLLVFFRYYLIGIIENVINE